MATLIGDGAHASDIMDTLLDAPYLWVQISHHTDLSGHGKFIIGINNPWERARIARELDEWDEPWVHPHTWIGPECKWEAGTHINYGVTMTRTTLGYHVTVSPGVTICGDVTIGDRVLIGAGTTICDRVTIGDDVTIGAGTVVLPESIVDTGATIIGVPARHMHTGVHVK